MKYSCQPSHTSSLFLLLVMVLTNKVFTEEVFSIDPHSIFISLENILLKKKAEEPSRINEMKQ
jgi:hypothetical protein